MMKMEIREVYGQSGLDRAVEMEKALYVRKYKGLGEWSDWKEVTVEVAEHKMSVVVYCDDQEMYFHPYQVGAEEYVL